MTIREILKKWNGGVYRGAMKRLEKESGFTISYLSNVFKGRKHAGGRWEPKDVDEREIPMPADLQAFLARALPALKRRRWVLDDEAGKRPSLEELSVYFRRITGRAGLRGNLQKLRASWLCHMLDDGIPAPVVQRWAGHSTLATTEGYTSPGKHDAAHIEKARPL